MKLPGMNTARFLRITQVANVILTISHSNAGEERVFSVIHKIRRDDRGSLQLQGTLSSLVTVKLNLPETKAHSIRCVQILLNEINVATNAVYNTSVVPC